VTTSATVSTTLTVTSTTAIVPPTCTPTAAIFGFFVYTKYYSGSGFTENFDNPGNKVNPSQTLDIDGNQNGCEAADTCAAYAVSLPYGAYFSFDLHFLVSQDKWVCTCCFDNNNDPSYFNVGFLGGGNGDVVKAYDLDLLQMNNRGGFVGKGICCCFLRGISGVYCNFKDLSFNCMLASF
jgi:hypothetical protein